MGLDPHCQGTPSRDRGAGLDSAPFFRFLRFRLHPASRICHREHNKNIYHNITEARRARGLAVTCPQHPHNPRPSNERTGSTERVDDHAQAQSIAFPLKKHRMFLQRLEPCDDEAHHQAALRIVKQLQLSGIETWRRRVAHTSAGVGSQQRLGIGDLGALGNDIEIRVKPVRRRKTPGTINVVFAG